MTMNSQKILLIIAWDHITTKFIEHMGNNWGLSSSAQISYLQSIRDMMDFRKSQGVTNNVPRNFAVTEVYVSRGKRNLSERKTADWSTAS